MEEVSYSPSYLKELMIRIEGGVTPEEQAERFYAITADLQRALYRMLPDRIRQAVDSGKGRRKEKESKLVEI